MEINQVNFFEGEMPLKIAKPIKLIELFAGYGSQSLALEYSSIPFEHHKICEWAIPSIQAYKDIHFTEDKTDYSEGMSQEDLIDFFDKHKISSDYSNPLTREQLSRRKDLRTIYNNAKASNNLLSICNIKGGDLEIKETDKFTYITTYSFPCFTAENLVLTSKGFKKIIDIKIGDKVLSHDNKYHKVLNFYNNGLHTCYSIKGMCIDEIQATCNHKFYVREKYRKGHNSIRCFREPVWKELKELTTNDYLGVAVNNKEKIYKYDDLPTNLKEFWWLIGRYIGDGWVRQHCGIAICGGKKKIDAIKEKLSALPFKYSINAGRTADKINISGKSLGKFCGQFGKGAGNKHLTNAILDLPTELVKSFLDGYFSADGCEINGVIKATSISRQLIYGIAQCVAKVYKMPYRIYKVKVQKTKVIEGRTVNQHDWYQLAFKTEKKKQDKAFYENGYIWYPIKEITEIGKQQVYDIEIEDSHSFTVQNTIVHNCQDLSLAGMRQGMAKGSGTRSGMLWEVERLLDEIKNEGSELPQILLMENVPEVIGKTNVKHFAEWVAKLEQLGYTSKWKLLNGKDYGVPQNRNRCFMISWLEKNKFYDFPKKIKLDKLLEDILEEEVDEKYYIPSVKVKNIIEQCNEKNIDLSNITKKGISLSNKGSEINQTTDYAMTLMARDYKGFGNQAMNAILEKKDDT